MRKILAIFIIICLVSCGIAEAARSSDFPMDGVCTGNNVRYRARPSTSAEIYGELFKGDMVTVISQRVVKGQIWYEVYDPNSGDRNAWIFGRYIDLVEGSQYSY